MDIRNSLQSAKGYYDAGNLHQAAKEYLQILEIQPDNVDALHTLATICFQFANYDSAFKLSKFALEFDPNISVLYYYLGSILKKAGHLDEAISYYQKAILINPDFADAYSDLGNAFKENRQPDEAMSCFQKALQINPNYSDAYNLGILHQEKGQVDEAVACFEDAPVLSRTDLLNYFIKTYKFENYLEIGIENPNHNFNSVMIENKIGVDPDPQGYCDYVMTSDLFFEQCCGNRTFDLIFIDGLHIEQQVTRDFNNSYMRLNKGGIIVFHDCNPPTEAMQYDHPVLSAWCGSAWKTFAELRMTRPDLQMHCIDIDQGCGIVKEGSQEVYIKDEAERVKQYSYLEMHRKELLNLITVDELKKIYS
jgi:tetratricopeptide (TPR) repeat protein